MTLQNNQHYCEEVLVILMFFLSRRDGCELSYLVLFTLVNSSHDSFSLMRSKHRVPLPLTCSLKGINFFSKEKKKNLQSHRASLCYCRCLTNLWASKKKKNYDLIALYAKWMAEGLLCSSADRKAEMAGSSSLWVLPKVSPGLGVRADVGHAGRDKGDELLFSSLRNG